MSVRILRVFLHGVEIGELLDGGHRVEFRFHASYWQLPDRPVLGLWFEGGARDEVYLGPGTLPAFFDNLEPEGGLGRAIARAHDLGDGPLELLAAAGHDLPGALQLVPDVPLEVRTRARVQLDPRPHPAFSLAGVQLKFSMSLDKDRRITIPSPGELPEWILKVPPTRRYRGLAENEAATMAWARRAGFVVPECRVVQPHEVSGVDGLPPRSLLLVRRFDRGPRVVHHEDLAQVFWLRPGQKARPPYGDPAADPGSGERQRQVATAEGLARFARKQLGAEGFEEYLRRLVFVIASGNGDAHLKNWSVWYTDRRRPTWAPLYDQVSTIAWDDAGLILPVFGRVSFASIHEADLLRLADHVGHPQDRTTSVIGETLDALRSSWLGEPSYPRHHEALLRAHWARKVPLLRRHGALP